MIAVTNLLPFGLDPLYEPAKFLWSVDTGTGGWRYWLCGMLYQAALEVSPAALQARLCERYLRYAPSGGESKLFRNRAPQFADLIDVPIDVMT